jgi:carbon monoxide dehydrogenase subunit G
MEITDRFHVSTPIDETWKVLLDIERIAPCLPGAQLEEIDGDEFRGVVKVKVGPITAQYKGTARLAEVDEAARRIVIDASGRDTRGQGNASAKILVTMTGDDTGTDVSVHTDLSITGKVAQFGRGVLGDVSAKLLGQFVERLEADVLSGDHASPAAPGSPPPPPPPPPAPLAGSAAPSATATAPAVSPHLEDQSDSPAVPPPPVAAVQPQGPRRIQGPEVEPVDLLATAGAPVGRRLIPVAIGALVAFLLFRRWRRRR